MAEKLEFGGAAWVKLVEEVALRLTAGVDLSGHDYGFCEEYTDPPSPLVEPGPKAGFTLRIRDGVLQVANRVEDDVDCKITVDYQAVLPLARLVFGGDPAKREAADKQVEALVTAGKMHVKPGKRPSELVPELANLHDDLAKLTA